ncbi:hypothetical protein BDW42DRAFT_131686 [Aspergillus taichungensis]|uniref:Uncharacterized protein n=1 Tax=Aspergillus taichungensis TaxID=482145 RepID=A0A2J5I704_9EURO|nr:hypothetical protein BDW42DRAFT_131686 [Aspergillus taichungensis]
MTTVKRGVDVGRIGVVFLFIVIRPFIASTPVLKQRSFACGNRHVDLLTSIRRLLQDVPVSLSLKSRYSQY